MNLYQKLLHIQKKVVGLSKDSKSFGYNYVSGSKVLEHIKPMMNEFGILLKQEVLSIENTRHDYVTSKGISKTEVLSNVMMKFTWIDTETGEKDENSFGANGFNEFEKGLGSALTYAERYFLLKFFHIATDEDDIDNPQRKKEETHPVAPNKNTPPPTKKAEKTPAERIELMQKAYKATITPEQKASVKADVLKALGDEVFTKQQRELMHQFMLQN